ncbi:MAG: hypothetical protein RLY86_2265 [Pseudomonadota bacterium]|jgi:glycogen debranching enzyme
MLMPSSGRHQGQQHHHRPGPAARFLPTALLLSALLTGCAAAPGSGTVGAPAGATPTLATLAVPVMAAENRIFSFTDKQSGYWYARSHEPLNTAPFSGWTVATRPVLQDYALWVDGTPLDRRKATALVRPDRMERRWPGLVEAIALLDGETTILLSLTSEAGGPAIREIGLEITGDHAVPAPAGTPGADPETDPGGGLWLSPTGDPGGLVLVAPMRPVPARAEGRRLTAPADAGGFVLLHGRDAADLLARLERVRTSGADRLAARRERMAALLDRAGGQVSNDADLDRALAWLTLTGDSLITRQLGTGIYAGLPWFNDYWGRDTFIALPGLTLVTGQFEAAREVLLSFARLQDTDTTSPTYGRVPNRARPEEVIYNTTDGTPRFVIALLDYIHYSGDRAIAADLYPAVKRATDAALERWTDPSGYLRHDDADTWMDAKEKGTRPFSPRGDRANDIQALWHGQLLAAAELASLNGDVAAAARWRAQAEKVAARFAADFIDPATGTLADHLNRDGSRDGQMRPNQFFALHLLPDPALRERLTRSTWEALVYPWGVASLSQEDAEFHPWHEAWQHYHKDAAYHNGTVWQWLNGIALQRLLELDQPDAAWPLFAAMNRTILTEGAVGSMAENADALPRDGAATARLSGTFLQAWSNAEQLRVWHQHMLGIQPDMLAGRVTLRPNLPAAVTAVDIAPRIGTGRLHLSYRTADGQTADGQTAAGQTGRYTARAEGIALVLRLVLPGFAPVEQPLAHGETWVAERSGTILTLRHLAADGQERSRRSVTADPGLMAEHRRRTDAFRTLRFATPTLRSGLKSLSVTHDPPLSY